MKLIKKMKLSGLLFPLFRFCCVVRLQHNKAHFPLFVCFVAKGSCEFSCRDGGGRARRSSG